MLRKTRALALEGSGEGRGRTQDAVPAAELLAMRRWLLGGAGDTGVMGPVCNPSAYHPREPCRVVLHEPLAPRRPYLPMGTLRRAVTYPDAAESRSVEQIAKVLEKVELDHLVARLDEDGPWDQTLSAGEKRRLAFARVLLHRPDIIVLDHAIAALDAPSQDRVMEVLLQELKHATVVSIGHRAELADFHHRKIILLRGQGGARLVSDVNPARTAQLRGRAAHDSWTGTLEDVESAGTRQRA